MEFISVPIYLQKSTYKKNNIYMGILILNLSYKRRYLNNVYLI